MTPLDVYRALSDNIARVIKGQSDTIRLLIAAFASGGHVLLVDYPGTGKTTLAKALALSMEARFRRAQFTPDLLPSDLTGVSIFNQRDQVFEFYPGPVFCNILLADEINRASPRTQSALLEAMAEKQVSIDGKRHALDDLFFVIATQNPVESHGTYPLPEAQMDRFAIQLSLGYLSPEHEVDMLTEQVTLTPIDDIRACVTLTDIQTLMQGVSRVRISQEIKRYIVDLVTATRHANGVVMGASPRASLALSRIAQALALFDGMDYVTPEHIQAVAANVIAHRLALDSQARFSGQTADGVVQDILAQIPVPV